MLLKLHDKLVHSKWIGTGELWLDPEGNDSLPFNCELVVGTDSIQYIWSYNNEAQKGRFTLNEDGAIWEDSWHHNQPVQCFNVPQAWGIVTVTTSYEVPNSKNWGWQSKLSERPDGSLVLQMTNIAPWGEEGRAVRMIFIPVNA